MPLLSLSVQTPDGRLNTIVASRLKIKYLVKKKEITEGIITDRRHTDTVYIKEKGIGTQTRVHRNSSSCNIHSLSHYGVNEMYSLGLRLKYNFESKFANAH